MKIQIIKPTVDQSYDTAVEKLLRLITYQLDDGYMVSPGRATSIADLCSGFRDLVESSHVVVVPNEEEHETIGKHIDIDKGVLKIPDKLEGYLKDILGKEKNYGTKRDYE